MRQWIDEATGKRQWVITVTDPDELKAKRASFGITLLADVQPVPTTREVLPGMRPVELDGLAAQPKVAGTGEFKYQSLVFRATGFKAAGASGGHGQVAKNAGGGRSSRRLLRREGDRDRVGDVAMVSKKSSRDDAYHRNGEASELVARSRPVDEATVSGMARASRAVASARRSIAANRDLSWWELAAVESAAEAFEDQGRHWDTRFRPEATEGMSTVFNVMRRGGPDAVAGMRSGRLVRTRWL